MDGYDIRGSVSFQTGCGWESSWTAIAGKTTGACRARNISAAELGMSAVDTWRQYDGWLLGDRVAGESD